MSANRNDQLTGHEYDGIREYDNPTPGWWHMIFLATIVFSAFYVLFWHFSPISWTIEDRWAAAKTRENAILFGTVGNLEGTEKDILRMKADPKFMAVGKSLFEGTCAQCHAADGGGMPGTGVNLTDEHYKNAKKIEDLFLVITDGANAGAMPAQSQRFSQNERVLLAAYAASLRGTKPAAPKAPEGEVIPPWPTGPAPDASGAPSTPTSSGQ